MSIYTIDITELNDVHGHNFIAKDAAKASHLAQVYCIIKNIPRAEITVRDETNKIVDKFNIGWKNE